MLFVSKKLKETQFVSARALGRQAHFFLHSIVLRYFRSA